MVVFDPRRTETAKVADEHIFVRPGTDAAVLLAMVHVLFEEGLTRPASYVDGRRAGPRRGRATSPPSTPSSVSGVPPTTIRRLDPRARRGRRRGGVRPARAVDPGLRLGLPVGRRLPQRAHRQPRPRGRRAVHRARDRLRDDPADRARPPRPLPQPGARRPGVRRRAAGVGVRRGDRDAGRGAGPRGADDRRQPGAVHPRRQAPRRGASRRSTSWRRSTSTSTRRPGTPT